MAHFGEKQNLLFSSILILLQTHFIQSKFDDYTTICSAKDPKLKECFKQSALQMLSNMTNGIPELQIPTMNPFSMPNINLEEPEIGFVLTVTNTAIFGLTTSTIIDVGVEPEKFKFYLNLHQEKEMIVGNYKIKGKISIMPIDGNGRVNITLTEVNTMLQFSGQPEIRNGVLHMKLTNVSMTMEPKRVKISLENLFNGNRMLGSIMNKVLNNSWQEFYKPLKPKLEHLCSDEAFKILQHYFSQIPYNQLFRDLEI